MLGSRLHPLYRCRKIVSTLGSAKIRRYILILGHLFELEHPVLNGALGVRLAVCRHVLRRSFVVDRDVVRLEDSEEELTVCRSCMFSISITAHVISVQDTRRTVPGAWFRGHDRASLFSLVTVKGAVCFGGEMLCLNECCGVYSGFGDLCGRMEKKDQL